MLMNAICRFEARGIGLMPGVILRREPRLRRASKDAVAMQTSLSVLRGSQGLAPQDDGFPFVMAGFIPAIHVLMALPHEGRGCPRQARA